MARFFVPEHAIQNNIAIITGPDVKHIARVLRLEPGDLLEICSGEGQGREFTATIREITNKDVTCEITGEKSGAAEPPVQVTLYQGLPKGEKMELVIQKSVELGVSRVIPVVCERTVVKLDEKKASERQTRWQRVAAEAAKQSRRTVIPTVAMPLPFHQAVEQIASDVLAIMPWEEEHIRGISKVLKSKTDGHRSVAVFIGPEGGFSREEADSAKARGVIPVSLGPRIMRTETAGIVTVAIVLYEIGDLGGTADG